MKFRTGHIGLLTQAKFFLNNIDKATYMYNLVFQGSNDMTTWTDIVRVGEEVHEGWNYYSWTDPATQPNYSGYRFLGNNTGACLINEIKFQGTKTIDDNNNDYTCPAKLIIDEVSQDLPNSVDYKDSKTSAIDSIVPRYGSVEGGT
jgi:hypothetical protein